MMASKQTLFQHFIFYGKMTCQKEIVEMILAQKNIYATPLLLIIKTSKILKLTIKHFNDWRFDSKLPLLIFLCMICLYLKIILKYAYIHSIKILVNFNNFSYRLN